MDLHEEDKNHLQNAHDTAMLVSNMQDSWVKIDCEKDLEMKSMNEITEMIIKEIL